MYSPKIELFLKKRGVRIGDTIRISTKKSMHEGILMPQTDLGDPNSLVLKLYNGYNIGVKIDNDTAVKLVKKGRPVVFKPSIVRATKDPNKPNVSILGCGGTIASRVEYKTGAVFPAFSPGDLLLSFPELKEIANISGRKLFDLLSEDMTPEHWKIIANEVVKEIKNGANGIVLMHGTDTMHYTAAALSFMLKDLPVPIVLVGAQRSSDRGSSDNAMNLTCAVLAAAQSDVAEVSVCMHAGLSDDYCYLHRGTKVRKMHTSRRDAFHSINSSPLAKIWYEEKKIEMLTSDYNKRSKRTVKIDDKLNANVVLVQIHPGMKPEFIESLKSFEGVVLTGTGLGHVPTNPSGDKFTKSFIPVLKNLIDAGIPVVIAPQTIFGRLDMNIYTAGRVLNEIGVNQCDWTAETALVKLMFVLGKTKDIKKIKEMMMENVAGEIGNRIDARGFV